MKRFFRGNWAYILLGILVLALFCLRLYHLTLLPIFADEAIYIRWAQVMRAEETLRFLPLSDGKEPLYMWAIIPFFKFIKDPLFAGRFVSILTGFGTMMGVSLLSWLLFKSKKVALVAALIYAVSPFTFFFDRMALVDSMLSMFGVWTFVFSYLAFSKERLDFAMIAGFMLGGAWLTKSPALFFALMLPVLWLFSDWKRGSETIVKHVFKLAGLTFPIVLIGYGMFNILRLGPNFQLIASRNLDYVYPFSHIFISFFDPLKGHIVGIIDYFVKMGPIGLVLLALLGILVNFRRKLTTIIPLKVWALVPIFITAEYSKVVTARYILYVIPFFAILAASSFETKSNLVKKIGALILAIFLIQSFLFDYQLLTNVSAAPIPAGDKDGYLEEWTAGQGIKEISSYIKDQAGNLPSGQKIVVGTEGYFGTLPDGLEIYLQDVKNVVVIGVGVNINKIPQSLLDSKASGNKTYLVINKSRLTVKPESLNLKLIASYPKTPRRVGSVEYNSLGPEENLYFFEVNK